MSNKVKTFDDEQVMWEMCDKIIMETQSMSFIELKAYIKQRLADPKTDLSEN